MNVKSHGLFGDKSHRLGNIFAVGTFDRLARGGVGYEVILITARLGVKSLCRQHLVAVKERQIFLVVGTL